MRINELGSDLDFKMTEFFGKPKEKVIEELINREKD